MGKFIWKYVVMANLKVLLWSQSPRTEPEFELIELILLLHYTV